MRVCILPALLFVIMCVAAAFATVCSLSLLEEDWWRGDGEWGVLGVLGARQSRDPIEVLRGRSLSLHSPTFQTGVWRSRLF